MNRKIALSLLTIAIALPSSAIANTQVRTDNVQVTTQDDGSIYVNTKNTSVTVPARRRWYPWHYWRTPWQSRNHCRQSTYQKTSQSSYVDNRVVSHNSTSSSYCR